MMSWKKKVRISMDDDMVETFIKDLLSGPWQWVYKSFFQEIRIDLHMSDPAEIRNRVLEWLERR